MSEGRRQDEEFLHGPEDDLGEEQRAELAAAIEADRMTPVTDDDFKGPEGLGWPGADS